MIDYSNPDVVAAICAFGDVAGLEVHFPCDFEQPCTELHQHKRRDGRPTDAFGCFTEHRRQLEGS